MTDTQTIACPLCGDYEGEPDSVKGHITAMTDFEHSGATGAQYQEEITDLVAAASGDVREDDTDTGDTPDDGDGDTDGASTDGSDTDANTDGDDGDTDGDMVTSDEYQDQQNGGGIVADGDGDPTPDTDTDTDGDGDTGGGGVPGVGLIEDVPTIYLVLAVAAVILVAYLLTTGEEGGSSGPNPTPDADTSGSDGADAGGDAGGAFNYAE